MKNSILHGDCLEVLKTIENDSVQLIWSDPPFNTGDRQRHSKGNYYVDRYKFDDYPVMMRNVITECHKKLKETGVMCLCLDYREVHRIKMISDGVFGEENFLGEIIWHSELGSISKKCWTMKHNTILIYSKTEDYTFHFDRLPTQTRKSPKGKYIQPKIVTSVWQHTMSNTDAQRVDYPNQKPLEIIEPFVLVHSDPGDVVLDPFAGSGSTGEAAKRHKRKYILIDKNEQAIGTMKKRLETNEVFSV